MTARPLPPGRTRASTPEPGSRDQRACVCGHGRHEHSNGSLWCIHGKTNFPVNYPCACHAFHTAAAADQPGAEAERLADECGDPYSGIGCSLPGCKHRPEPAPSAGQDTERLRDELAAAIATIEYSRQTHVEWAAHLRQNPEQPPSAIGDAEYHEKAVREYDNVLAVLRSRADCRLDRCPHYVAAIGATVVAGDERAAQLIAERDEARAQVQRVRELFDGGPDTSCRTTWRREAGWSLPGSTAPLTECVEVPLDGLRDALDAP